MESIHPNLELGGLCSWAQLGEKDCRGQTVTLVPGDSWESEPLGDACISWERKGVKGWFTRLPGLASLNLAVQASRLEILARDDVTVLSSRAA